MECIVLCLNLGKSHSVNDVRVGNVSLGVVSFGSARLASVTISAGSSFQTLSRFGSFHKTNVFRETVILFCGHWISNMVLTESQFRTSKVSNRGNEGSKVKGSAYDEKWHPSTINVFK